MAKKQAVRLTTIYCFGLASMLAGLGYARWAPGISVSAVPASAILLLVTAVSRRRWLILVVAVAACFVLGWWRGQAFMKHVSAYDNLIGQTVTVTITATEDAVYSERGQLEFGANAIKLLSPSEQSLVGELSIEGSGEPMVYKGDRLEVSGRLFRKRGGRLAGMSFAKVKVIKKSNSLIDSFRRRFAAGMQNVLPEELASFGMGILIGQRTTLNQDLEDDLITTGLIHIVAVSGYNLTIIIVMVRRLFRRRSRFQSLLFSLMLIGSFLFMTGFSPSIVRAGIVSSLSLVAWFWGRTLRPLLLLIAVATMTAMSNPLYLWSNIGWYLSFTSFFGVLVLGPLINSRFLPGRLQENVVLATLSETISAQICTLPVILYIFGRLSTISILANVLVVPLTPLAMLLSFISGIAGMMHFQFAKIVVWPTQIVLDYMLSVSSVLAKIPYANVELHINTLQLVVLNSMIISFIILLTLKLRQKSVILTEIKEQNVRTQQMVNYQKAERR